MTIARFRCAGPRNCPSKNFLIDRLYDKSLREEYVSSENRLIQAVEIRRTNLLSPSFLRITVSINFCMESVMKFVAVDDADSHRKRVTDTIT